jgi:putative spermidine/putrescine transport system substrate-binding protein
MKEFDWVTKFEEASGCKVNVKTANTSDEMVALMNEGGFDLVTASGDASLRLVAGDRVQPINIDLIPSWSTVDDAPETRPGTRSTAFITACPTCGGRTC